MRISHMGNKTIGGRTYYEYSFIVQEGDTVIIQVNNDIIHRDIIRKKADGKLYPKKWLNDVHPS